jgi:F-box domain
MPSIPIDVLREILEHVDEKDLATLCRVNKIFCSCSQDVLYRDIEAFDEDVDLIQTLAQSTHLARRVRSFKQHYPCPGLATALRNMSLLRSLHLYSILDESILDECTVKLDSFACFFPYSESLQNFLNSQPSLTKLALWGNHDPLPPLDVDEKFLSNLTCVKAMLSWLGLLIPGRPVREVSMHSHSDRNSTDLSFFTHSTAPIQKLSIHFKMLYPKPVSLLVSIFPSLVHLKLMTYNVKWTVRVPLCYI